MKAPTMRLRPNGAPRDGYLTEFALAVRWGRSPNTLSGWRTRPHAGLTPLEPTILDGTVYYAHDWIAAYEADPANATVRPASLRGTPLPPLRTRIDQHREDEAIEARIRAMLAPPSLVDPEPAQLPLSLPHGRVEVTPAPRGFASLRIEAGYALAIATDGAAFFASVLGGLDILNWAPVRSLPADDQLLARFTGRAA